MDRAPTIQTLERSAGSALPLPSSRTTSCALSPMRSTCLSPRYVRVLCFRVCQICHVCAVHGCVSSALFMCVCIVAAA